MFRRIGEAALRHLGVPADTGGEVLRDLEIAARQRRRAVREAGVQPAPEPEPELVLERQPIDGEVIVPDVSGETARRALAVLHRAGLGFLVEGTGLVVAQSPSPGSIARRGAAVRLVLERPDLRGERRAVPGASLAAVLSDADRRTQ